MGEFLRQFPSVTHEMAVPALEEAKDSLVAGIRILLEECLPLDLRHTFPNHDAHTAQRVGSKARKWRPPKTRDNWVVYIARAFVEQAKLDEAINDLKPTLGPDVVRLRYTLGQDWSGESAIFFRILLSDQASRRDQLRNATNQIQNAIMQRLQPLEQWGVLPYFSFRSLAEQAALQEEAWA